MVARKCDALFALLLSGDFRCRRFEDLESNVQASGITKPNLERPVVRYGWVLMLRALADFDKDSIGSCLE